MIWCEHFDNRNKKCWEAEFNEKFVTTFPASNESFWVDSGLKVSVVRAFIHRVEAQAFSDGLRHSSEKIKALSNDLINACVDDPAMQMTWNSALRQSSYKLDALARQLASIPPVEGA